MRRRRPPEGMGFSSAVMVACLFAARSVDGFVAPDVHPRFVARAPTHHGHSVVVSMATPVSRGQLLRELIPAAIVGAVVVGPVRQATAALPTAEDYSFGTGSKIKRPETQDDLSTPLPKSSVDPNNPVEVVGAVSGELDRVEALVIKERWGDALFRLRSYPLTTLKSPTLGMASVGDVARALGVNKSKASDILEASMEAGLTLREVEDVVFSNTRTLEFFNSADYKQVEDLAKNRQPTDLTEPLQLLSDTRKLVSGVSELMGAGAGTP